MGFQHLWAAQETENRKSSLYFSLLILRESGEFERADRHAQTPTLT
jgi:hypothetical protein